MMYQRRVMEKACRVAVVKWADSDGIADAIADEFRLLGYQPSFFRFDGEVPGDVQMVLSFAPYGRLLQIPHQLQRRNRQERPLYLHWNFESLPNIQIPWRVQQSIGRFVSWVGRLQDAEQTAVRTLGQKSPLRLVSQRMHKFRYLGDYSYAYHQGWLDLLFDSSQIFARRNSQHGLPTQFIPWGISPDWHADLKLERDIDVLWMGKQRTRRRAQRLKQIRAGLARHGVNLYVADGVENPFIFGDTRTHFLNRAKITLGLLPTPYDPAFSFRFNVAAANKSLVVSEPVMPHMPLYRPGCHFVCSPVEEIVDTILYYLNHEAERTEIVENAYQVVTRQAPLSCSIRQIVSAVQSHMGQ